jgi:hypothetical protein
MTNIRPKCSVNAEQRGSRRQLRDLSLRGPCAGSLRPSLKEKDVLT